MPGGPNISLCHKMRYTEAYHKSDVHHTIHALIARVRSETSYHSKCIQNSVSLTQQVQKKLFCLGISGFKLSMESCSPVPISLTVLYVACCVENKRTHFSRFRTSPPFFTSFFHSIDVVSPGCTSRGHFSPHHWTQQSSLDGMWQRLYRSATPTFRMGLICPRGLITGHVRLVLIMFLLFLA